MNNIEMINFGRTLTDRPYGKQIAQKILANENFPIALDFKGVISLGSSFGDEILSAIAPKQNYMLIAFNANEAIKSCLEKVAKDAAVIIEFKNL